MKLEVTLWQVVTHQAGRRRCSLRLVQICPALLFVLVQGRKDGHTPRP
jgi:hypothetical protein